MTESQPACRCCGERIPKDRISWCRRLRREAVGCSTRCSRNLAQRAFKERERERRGISAETDRSVVDAIVSAAIEAVTNDVREQYFESSRSYKKRGAERGRITALRPG